MEVDKKSYPIYALDVSSRVIYLKTYSKILLPGLRIATTVIQSKLINKFQEYKRWTDLNTSILSQGALQIYIKSGMFDKHIKKIRNVYYERMNYLNKVIISLNNSNVKWYIPKCGFFASFEIKNSINTENFIKRLYMQDILIGGMSRYYLKNNTNNKFMRISISSVNNDKIAKGISIMMNETKY